MNIPDNLKKYIMQLELKVAKLSRENGKLQEQLTIKNANLIDDIANKLINEDNNCGENTLGIGRWLQEEANKIRNSK